jgi:hypothetical protein
MGKSRAKAGAARHEKCGAQPGYAMKSYNSAERALARLLDSVPAARLSIKFCYQRANYLVFRERDFRAVVHPETAMVSLPEESFFGYYDKTPWSPDLRHALAHSPLQDGTVAIQAYDLRTSTMRRVGSSRAWNWQQGSMLQWLSNTGELQVIWNDVIDGKLGARIASLASGEKRAIPWPIQTLHPNGQEALTLNYKRLDCMRPEYGYSYPAENFAPDVAPDCDGIWHVDLRTGEGKLVLTLAALQANQPRLEMGGSQHKVNHLMYSPRGEKVVFMHRWLGPRGKFSRLYVANRRGANLKLLLDARMVSHYAWRDEDHVLAWARTEEKGDHYYLINVSTGAWEIIGEGVLDVFGDGHPSYSPNRRWIVTDTYPDRRRQRHLLLYSVTSDCLLELGRFLSPWKYDGAVRCDLHPRWSPDGNWISIDSVHSGGRAMYILDLSRLVAERS